MRTFAGLIGFIFAVVVFIGLTAPSNTTPPDGRPEVDRKPMPRSTLAQTYYIRDPRTNLCFSVIQPENVHESRSAVECSELVLKAIEEDRAELAR